MGEHYPTPKRSGQAQADETPLFAGADVDALPGPWFDVAATRRVGQCRSCLAEVYWIMTERGKMMPVDCEVAGGQPPTATTAGRGLSHFATCPNADEHRRARR